IFWNEVELNIEYIKTPDINVGFDKYTLYRNKRTYYNELNYYNYYYIGKFRIPYEITWLRDNFIPKIKSYIRFSSKNREIKKLVVILFSTIAIAVLIIGSSIGLSKIVYFYIELLKNILVYFSH
ncbi:hypothetical protein ERM22_10285, partial [Clostridioides difficile]|nr:hypothetical protein [Clostridioides difficile]